jgi:hypothetical protein
VLCCVAGTALAAVSAQEAARLGKDLTPMGAEKAGNAAGTIPAWDGGITSPAKAGFPDFKTGGTTPTRSRPTSRCTRSMPRTPRATRSS